MKLPPESIEIFNREKVFHPRFVQVMKTVLHAYEMYQIGIAQGVVIIAPPGCGKSDLIDCCHNSIGELIEPQEDRNTFGSIKIEMRSGATRESVMKLVLKQLEIKTDGFNRTDLEDLYYTQLVGTGVALLAIDEAHHLLRIRNKQFNTSVAQLLKMTIEKAKVPVVLLGTEKLKPLLELDQELASRMTVAPKLVPMSCANEEEQQYFAKFLQTYLSNLPVKSIDITTKSNILRVELATGGSLRRLSYLVNRALLNVDDARSTTLKLEDYAIAYEASREAPIFNAKGNEINPFRAPIDQVVRALGRA